MFHKEKSLPKKKAAGKNSNGKSESFSFFCVGGVSGEHDVWSLFDGSFDVCWNGFLVGGNVL